MSPLRRSPAGRHIGQRRPQPVTSGAADAFGRRTAGELASRGSDRPHRRPSWRHGELATRICAAAGLLSAQAEYQARILPAPAEQMLTETTRCGHAQTRKPVNGQVRSWS